MKCIWTFAIGFSCFLSSMNAAPDGLAQVVINEIVKDERTAGSGQVNPDTREFIELYNAGDSAENIGNWRIRTVLLADGSEFFVDMIPPDTMLGAGEYYVIGSASVPKVNFTLSGDLWPDLHAVYELRDAGNLMVDAVAIDTYIGNEIDLATQEQLDQIGFGETAGPGAKGGWWGQMISTNVNSPNTRQSLGRYLDGRDTDINGRDFGVLPLTPGESNNLPQNPSHTVPDVDALAVGSAIGTDYYAPFVLPRVIDPTQASAINPTAIAPSPQEGNAIVVWDETGGGNAAYSKELVNSFEISAYIETSPLDLAVGAAATQSEATIYGIGTTDPFFGTPDSGGLLGFGSSSNGSTGLGWLIQRVDQYDADTQTATPHTLVQIIDFNDGGDGVPADEDWRIIGTISEETLSTGWHTLRIDYDPETGAVSAGFDDEVFNFETISGLVGNFYVGYRENITEDDNPSTYDYFAARPPTFDLFEADVVPPVLAGDYNDDGTVDAADYTVWRDNLGTSFVLENETETLGMVTEEDYDAWKSNFGATGAETAGASHGAVPEPTSMILVALGAIALGGASVRRRR